MNVDLSKRAALKDCLCVGAGIAMMTPPFLANAASPFLYPILVGGVASTVISVIDKFFSQKRDAQITLEIERKKLMMGRIDWLYAQLPVNEQLLLLRNGSFYNALLSENFDTFGTILAVSDGKLHISRGKYGGKMTSDIGTTISNEHYPQTGVVPVPVDISPIEDDRVNRRIKEYLSDREGLSMQQYDAKYTPSTISKMSFARNPTSNGSDFAFITSIDKTQRIKLDNMTLHKVRTADVPPKIYA